MKIVELLCNSMAMFFPKVFVFRHHTLFQISHMFFSWNIEAADFVAIRLFWFFQDMENDCPSSNFSPRNRSSGKRNSDTNLVFGFEESEDWPQRNRPRRLKEIESSTDGKCFWNSVSSGFWGEWGGNDEKGGNFWKPMTANDQRDLAASVFEMMTQTSLASRVSASWNFVRSVVWG